MTVAIDWCPTERILEYQKFLDTYWKRNHILARDRELLVWQHSASPDTPRLSVLIADVHGELVGTLGVIVSPFSCRGKRIEAAWLTTWLAVPEWRSRQVGISLLRSVLEGPWGAVGTLGANETSLQIYKRLGFAIRPGIGRWVLPVDETSWQTLMSGSGQPVPAGSALQVPLAAQTEDAPMRLIEWSDEAAARWTRIWEQRFAPQLVGTWRDGAYLRWRYVEHPRYRYRVVFGENGSGSITGLAVWRLETIRERPERVLRILEFLALDETADALAQALVREARNLKVAFADFYCTGRRWAHPLERAGFVAEDLMPTVPPALFQPLDYRPRPLALTMRFAPECGIEGVTILNNSDLYLTRSDCDQDRPN